MQKRSFLTAAFVLSLGALVLSAQPAAAEERGMILSLSCYACHGPSGRSPGSMPTIAGKSAKYITKILGEFASGKRPSTVMGRIARGYTDQEIADLAAYFASPK